MSVVFDEVETTIEPPLNESPEPETLGESEQAPSNLEKLYQFYMGHQRRTKRLFAD